MSTLVAYFSASGTTEGRAKQVAAALDADLFEIEPKKHYSQADLDWTNSRARSTVEGRDPSARPKTARKVEDLAKYDTVVIGFPVWWYTAPRIINTFIEENDLSGKKIYVFATSGGSDVKKSFNDLKDAYSNLDFVSGKLLNGGVDADEVRDWVK